MNVNNVDKIKFTILQQGNVNVMSQEGSFGIIKHVSNVYIRDILTTLIKNANNVQKISYFHYKHKNANFVLCKSHILMDNFAINALTILTGIIRLIHVKVVLIIKFIPLDLKSVYVSQVVTETNYHIVLNVFLQCMSIKLQKYVYLVNKVLSIVHSHYNVNVQKKNLT